MIHFMFENWKPEIMPLVNIIIRVVGSVFVFKCLEKPVDGPMGLHISHGSVVISGQLSIEIFDQP